MIQFGFDANGDPNATYKLVSWFPRRLTNGTFSHDVTYQHVGNYSKDRGDIWTIDTGAIFWKDDNGTQLTDQVRISDAMEVVTANATVTYER